MEVKLLELVFRQTEPEASRSRLSASTPVAREAIATR